MSKQSQTTGKLFVVATPIGNLQDISPRAIRVLSTVSVIAAEDTRHSKKLLVHCGVGTRLVALHDHNERDMSPRVIEWLGQGDDVALISDAGTPLISDPGYLLVRAAHAAGIEVLSVPGPSALTAALSVAGLPTDRFRFEGFLPAKQAARRKRLEALQSVAVTLVFYESSHRISGSLADMADCLGGERRATLARELTKTWETVRQASLAELNEWLCADVNQQKGEFVVLVEGMHADTSGIDAQARHTLAVLLADLPLKQAAALAAKITGFPKNSLYEYGLELKHARQAGRDTYCTSHDQSDTLK